MRTLAILQPSPLDALRTVFADLQRSGELSPQIDMGADFENQSIESLGLDSVGRVTLLATLEETAGVILNEDDFCAAMTIGDLAEIVQRRVAR